MTAKPDLDAMLERLIATCGCESCERYRRWFAARAAMYAVRIEQELKRTR